MYIHCGQGPHKAQSWALHAPLQVVPPHHPTKFPEFCSTSIEAHTCSSMLSQASCIHTEDLHQPATKGLHLGKPLYPPSGEATLPLASTTTSSTDDTAPMLELIVANGYASGGSAIPQRNDEEGKTSLPSYHLCKRREMTMLIINPEVRLQKCLDGL